MNRYIKEATMVRSNPLVLVVDDEPHMRNVLQRILENEGYGVVTAPNGDRALRVVKELEPDIIVLDVMMPGIDGREVCHKARALSKAIQIIYFTAKIGPNNPVELKELRREADGFIAKPATSKQILSKVGSVLQSSHRD